VSLRALLPRIIHESLSPLLPPHIVRSTCVLGVAGALPNSFPITGTDHLFTGWLVLRSRMKTNYFLCRLITASIRPNSAIYPSLFFAQEQLEQWHITKDCSRLPPSPPRSCSKWTIVMRRGSGLCSGWYVSVWVCLAVGPVVEPTSDLSSDCHHHHKHQGLDPLIRSVSRVTAARANASSVFQLFSFLVVGSGMISKGFGFVAFFASGKAISVCIHLSCPVCL